MQLSEVIGPWRQCCQVLGGLYAQPGDLGLQTVLGVFASAADLMVFAGKANDKTLCLVRALA